MRTDKHIYDNQIHIFLVVLIATRQWSTVWVSERESSNLCKECITTLLLLATQCGRRRRSQHHHPLLVQSTRAMQHPCHLELLPGWPRYGNTHQLHPQILILPTTIQPNCRQHPQAPSPPHPPHQVKKLGRSACLLKTHSTPLQENWKPLSLSFSVFFIETHHP